MGPVIVAVYMVQQINCIRNKDGEIIEVCSVRIGLFILMGFLHRAY